LFLGLVSPVATVDKELSKRIMQARMAKKMSQKDLAAVSVCVVRSWWC